VQPETRFATSADGTRIAYSTVGEGPPLLFVPGINDLGVLWGSPETRPFFEAMGAGRRLTWYDPRGVGASQREVDALGLDEHIADLSAVVDCLPPAAIDVVTGGDGCARTLAYHAAEPTRFRRAVLWSPFVTGAHISRGRLDGMLAMIGGNWPLFTRAMGDVMFPRGPIEAQRWYAESYRESFEPETLAKMLALSADVDVRSVVPAFRIPTLAIVRADGQYVPANVCRAVAASLPDCRLVELPGDEAFPFTASDRERIVELTRDFLDEGRADVGSREPPGARQGAGFQTILFTDLEASTELNQRLGDETARVVVRGHDAAVREALGRYGGREVKHTGDGIMASFRSAVAAVEAGLQIQHDLAAAEVRTRIGVNAGEPIAEEDDLFGTAVQLAARITDRAEPGQVLVSRVVADLCAGKTFEFRGIGDAALKGFDDPVPLYEVRAG
jgi:class 3 adenylate cyclase